MKFSDKTKTVLLKDIHPHPLNSKVHSDDQIKKVKESIETYGFISPIVVDKNNTIILGHCRYLSLKLIDPDQEIEVLDCSYLEQKAVDKLRILENRLVSNEWNTDNLLNEIENIYDGFDDLDIIIEELGFTKEELDKLIPLPNTEGDDEIPEVITPVTKIGDLWNLGKHRLLCGDSTIKEDVNKLMNGIKSDMVFSDPPYLMGFTGNVHADGSKSFNAKHGKIKNDKMSREDGDNFLYKIFDMIKQHNTGAYYVCFYRLGIDYITRALEAHGLTYKAMIIWDKGNHTLSNSDYMSKYECIWYGWIDKHFFAGDRSNFDIWDIARTPKNVHHPTTKPLALMEKAILNSSMNNSIVLDLFLGSGSTLIACEKTNRICYGMELDEHYCDVIRDRYIKWCTDNNKTAEVKLNGKKWIAEEIGV